MKLVVFFNSDSKFFRFILRTEFEHLVLNLIIYFGNMET